MFRGLVTASLLLLSFILGAQGSVAQQQDIEQRTKPGIEDLGNQSYRIGNIEIDKAAGVFKVSGKVLRDEPPLEYLVVTKDGAKSYESVLEVNADAYQFNLACILIGLDASHATPPEQRVFGQPIQGDPVAVTVSWLQDGKQISANGSEFFLHGMPPEAVASQDWVYTGSLELQDGRYLADLAGTLLGFVHRGESIIEHKQGIGLSNYGSVMVNKKLLPAVGSSIELSIRRLNTDK